MVVPSHLSVLDLQIQSDGSFPSAQEVSEELRAMKRIFPDLLPQRAIDYIDDCISSLANNYGEAPQTNRRGVHRLQATSQHAPCFVAFDPDFRLGLEYQFEEASLERLCRLALLLHCSRDLTLKSSEVVAVSNFTRLFRHGPLSVEAHTNRRYLVEGIQQRDWNSVSNLIASGIKIDGYQRRYEELSIACERLQGRFSVVTTHSGDFKKRVSRRPIPSSVGNAKPEEPTQSIPGLRISPPTTSTEKPQHQSKIAEHALALKGHRLRLNRRWGFASDEALTQVELSVVVPMLQTTTLESDEDVARQIWLLVLVTGRGFDKILAHFFSSLLKDKVNNPVQLEHRDGSWVLRAMSPKQADYGGIPSEISAFDSRWLYILLPNEASSILNWLHDLSQQPKTERFDKLNDLIKAKAEVRRQVRDKVWRFNESRLRGSLAQQLLKQTWDITLLQLIFGESFESGMEGLHYCCFANDRINQEIQRAHDDLNLLLTYPSCDSVIEKHSYVGAPRALVGHSMLKTLSYTLQRNRDAVEAISPQEATRRRLKLFNARTDEVATKLGLVIAVRSSAPLNRLTAGEISINAATIVFSEKPIDPATYRRFPVFPRSLAIELERYWQGVLELIQWLRELQHPTYSSEALRYLELVTASRRPVFVHLSEANNRIIASAWSGKFLWQKAGLPSNAPNLARHSLMTWLREQNVPAIFADFQIGHGSQYSFFGRQGLVSQLELAGQLDEPLSAYLSSLGFRVRDVAGWHQLGSRQKTQRSLNWFRSNQFPTDLRKREKDVFAADRKRFLRRYKVERLATKQFDIAVAICSAIRELIPSYEHNKIPHGIALNAEDVDAIRNALFERAPQTIAGYRHALRRLRVQLRIHIERDGWKVESRPREQWAINEPPDITEANTRAFEYYIQLQEQLLNKVDLSNPLGQAALSLILFSGVQSLENLVHILRDAGTAPVVEPGFLVCADTQGDAIVICGPASTALMSSASKFARKQLTIEGVEKAIKVWCSEHLERISTPLELADIFALTRLARRLLLPGAFADVESGRLANRSLPRERMLSWVTDSVLLSVPDNNLATNYRLKCKRKIVAKDAKAERAAYQTLRNIIEEPKQQWKILQLKGDKPQSSSHKAVQKVIGAWTEQKEIPCISFYVAHWAVLLHESGRNLKTGKTLKQSTILRMLSEVIDPLVTGACGVELEEADEEVLQTCIQSALHTDDDRRNDQSTSLNRMFAELREKYEVPVLALPSRRGTMKPSIDAGILSASETKIAQELLGNWALDHSVGPAVRSSIGDAQAATKFAAKKGLRRSELVFLKRNKILGSSDSQIVQIAPNHARGLKSPAANRIIENAEIQEHIDTQVNPSSWVFPYLADPVTTFDPLDLVVCAVRRSSSDQTTRFRHLRHGRVNEFTCHAFSFDELTKRIEAFCHDSSEVGHAHFTTSIGNYCHIIQFLIASIYDDSHRLGSEQISSFYKLKDSAIRKRKSRQGCSFWSAANLIACKKGKVKNTIYRRVFDISEQQAWLAPHALLRQQAVSIPAILTVISEWIAGSDIVKATSISGFPRSQMLLMLEAVRSFCEWLEWWCVSEDRIRDLAEQLSCPDSYLLPAERKFRRRDYSKAVVAKWIKSIEHLTNEELCGAAERIEALLQSVDLNNNGWVNVRLRSHRQLAEFESAAAQLNLPFRFETDQNAERPSSATLLLTDRISHHERVSATTIKVLLALVAMIPHVGMPVDNQATSH